MKMTVTTSLPPDDIRQLDRMGRDQGLSRAEAIRAAIRWYIAMAELLPFTEDQLLDDVEA